MQNILFQPAFTNKAFIVRSRCIMQDSLFLIFCLYWFIVISCKLEETQKIFPILHRTTTTTHYRNQWKNNTLQEVTKNTFCDTAITK